jgi:hypothetical protein
MGGGAWERVRYALGVPLSWPSSLLIHLTSRYQEILIHDCHSYYSCLPPSLPLRLIVI